jgi:hypothetical protein
VQWVGVAVQALYCIASYISTKPFSDAIQIDLQVTKMACVVITAMYRPR